MACLRPFPRSRSRIPIIALGLAAAFGTGLAAEAARAQQPAPPSTLASDLLAYNVRMTVRVARLDNSARQAEAIARHYAGRMVSRRDGDVTLRVPSAQLEPTLQDLAALGAEQGRSVEVTNVTDEWIDAQAQLRSAVQARARLVAMGRLATEGVKEPIVLQREIARVDDEMASLRARIAGLEDQGSHAVIEVDLEPIQGTEAEPMVPFELPFPWLSRLGLEHLTNLQNAYAPPPPDQASYHLNDEGEVSLDLAFMRPADTNKLGGTSMTVAVGTHVRGMFETDPVGGAVGMDVSLGGGVDGGFLYELRMLVGPGVSIGPHVSIGAVTGAGLSGLTGNHIPFGVDLPVELFATSDITRYAQVRLWGRSSWVVASDARQDGAKHAPFGDELYAGASFILGEDSQGEDRERVGLVLGLMYGEMLGTRIGQLTVGYGGGFGDRQMSY